MIQPIQIPSNNNCLLTYSFDTYPTPLQVSPEDDDKHQHGIITVVVSNPSGSKVYCQEIKLTLPVGAGSAHLTETPDTISAFVYTNKATKAWKVQNNNGVLTATPKAGAFIEITSSDSLVFYIYYIQVNKQIGTFSIDIAERTSENSSSVTTKPYTQSFSKFPHGFFFKDLAVYKETQEDGNTVLSPITYLDNSDNGEKIALAWHGGSNATYTLFYSGQPDGVTLGENNSKNNGKKRWWFYLEPIRDTTTFVLKASVKQGSETLEAYLSTTVVVKKPDIQANSLKVGDATRKPGELEAEEATLKPNEIQVFQNSLAHPDNKLGLKIGVNNDPTISTQVTNRWLRIGSKDNAIAFWVNGGADIEGDTQPQMLLDKDATLKVGGRDTDTTLKQGELKIGEDTTLTSGELKLGETTLSKEELKMGETTLNSGELKVGSATLKSGELKVGDATLNSGKLELENKLGRASLRLTRSTESKIENMNVLVIRQGTTVLEMEPDYVQLFWREQIPGQQSKREYVCAWRGGRIILTDRGSNEEIWVSSPNSSDIKLKTNIAPITDVLAALAAIRGVQFDWKDKTMGEGKQLGVIAQEVEKVYPEVVEGIEGNKIVHYEKLVPVLIEGVKALTTRNEALEQRVQAQESQLKALTARLDKLERKA